MNKRDLSKLKILKVNDKKSGQWGCVLKRLIFLTMFLCGCSESTESTNISTYRYTIVLPPPEVGREIDTYDKWLDTTIFTWTVKRQSFVTDEVEAVLPPKNGYEIELEAEHREKMTSRSRDGSREIIEYDEAVTHHLEVAIRDSSSKIDFAPITGSIVTVVSPSGDRKVLDPVQGNTFHYSGNFVLDCSEELSFEIGIPQMRYEGTFADAGAWSSQVEPVSLPLFNYFSGNDCGGLGENPTQTDSLLLETVTGEGPNAMAVSIRVYQATDYKRWNEEARELELIAGEPANVRIDVDIRDHGILPCIEGVEYCSREEKESIAGLKPLLEMTNETTGRTLSEPVTLLPMYMGKNQYSANLGEP